MQSHRAVVSFVVSLVATLIALYVLINLPGDAGLVRIGMAASGFIIFVSLFAAVTMQILRDQNRQGDASSV